MARFERSGFGGRGGFGRRRDDRFDMPKPVNVGEEYDVEISEVGSRGDGIARVKNFVVFVNGAKQGEKIKIKIKEVMSRFAIGEKVGGEAAGATEAVEEAAGAAEETAEAAEEEPEEVTVEAEEKTSAEETEEEV